LNPRLLLRTHLPLASSLLALAVSTSASATTVIADKGDLKKGETVEVVKEAAGTCTVKHKGKEVAITFWKKVLSDCTVPKVEVVRKEPIKIQREDKESLDYANGELTLYRAEDRSPGEIKPKGGFTLWKGYESRTPDQAHTFMLDLIKKGDPWEVVDDYVKNNNGKFVSGGIDDGFGGFINKNYYYKIKIKLHEQHLDQKSLGVQPALDKEKGKYRIFTDTVAFKDAKMIGVKITGAPEVSFATNVPLADIVAYKKKAEKDWTVVKDWKAIK
jgi:hypothetical protein